MVCDYHNRDLFAPAGEEAPALLPLHDDEAPLLLPLPNDVANHASSSGSSSVLPVAAPGSPTVATRTLEHLLRSPVQRTLGKRARLADEAAADQKELSTQELEALID